ncbi:MAG: AAA family ATPase [Planctomycetota bacterium]
MGAIVLGKETVLRQALGCLLAGGHLLIEDIPGVGKTTLAHALARLLGLEQRRVQCTADMLPADILGANVYNRQQECFVFHPGPVFTQILLADELNRASPKTQSALLEAMEETRVTIDGTVHDLPQPFFVMATQNPMEQAGTFPLPESQLDRFLMRLELGIPDRAAERRMLGEPSRQRLIDDMQQVIDHGDLRDLQAAVERIHVSEALTDYLLDLLEHSRRVAPPGLSPRAGLGLQRAARAWALMQGRAAVLPEDIQAIAPAVMIHRLRRWAGTGRSAEQLVEDILTTVPVP